MLLTIVGNVVDNPGEAKYRRIRRASTAFQQSLGSLPGGCESLQAIGFIVYTEPNGEEVRATCGCAPQSGFEQVLFWTISAFCSKIGDHSCIRKAILSGSSQIPASPQLGGMQVLSMTDIRRDLGALRSLLAAAIGAGAAPSSSASAAHSESAGQVILQSQG